MTQRVIFISYSRKDEREKNKLLSHLRVLQHQGLIDLWSDDRIGPGTDWEQEISKAMTQASVAILLISVNFLTSDFILSEEIPKLLKRRESEGLTIFPVITRPCAWQEVGWLTKMNVRPKNGRPIWGTGARRVDEDLTILAKEVASVVKAASLITPIASSTSVKSERAQDTASRQRIQLYLRGDFSSLSADRKSAVIDALAAIIEISSQEIEVYGVYEGSIVFDLGVPTDAARRLRSHLELNDVQLRLLKVEKVLLEIESGEIEEWHIKEGKFALVTSPYSTTFGGIHEKSQIVTKADETAQIVKAVPVVPNPIPQPSTEISSSPRPTDQTKEKPSKKNKWRRIGDIVGIVGAIAILLACTLSIISYALPTLLTLAPPTVTLAPPTVEIIKPFSYQIRIYTEDTYEPIEDAQVIIEVSAQAPLDTVTDSNGLARVLIDSNLVNEPGFLIVEAVGYRRYMGNIDLIQGKLPSVIYLKPLVVNVSPTPAPTTTDTPIIIAVETTPTSPSPTSTVVSNSTPIALIETFTPIPTETPTPTSPPSPTDTPNTSEVPINPPVVDTPYSPEMGVFLDFETPINWRRGNQPYGQLNHTAVQVREGRFAGELTYNFPPVEQNFVVFLSSIPLAGHPPAFSAWVYGDGSGHFLNMWLKDADGETWQATFGQIQHTGWQQMSAMFGEDLDWPNGLIDGSRNETIDYPVSFQALVLDGVPDNKADEGTIYIDDLKVEVGGSIPSPVPTPDSGSGPLPSPVPTSVPAPMVLTGRLAFPVDDGTGHYDIWIVDLPDGQPFKAISGARQPNFSEKEGLLLVNGDSVSPGLNLLLYNSSLNFVNMISESPNDEYPFWDPDGTRLTYSRSSLNRLFTHCSLKRPNQDNGVECQNIDEFGVITTQNNGQLAADMPVWTRDGNHNLIFRWRTGPPYEGIGLIGSWATLRDKNPLQSLPEPILLFRSSTARPTDTQGNILYFFASDIDSNWEVYGLDLKGGSPINLSNSASSSDGLPTVSPDGRWVAFASDRDGRWAIWAVPASGGTPQKLTDFPKSNPWGRGDHDWTTERISWGP